VLREEYRLGDCALRKWRLLLPETMGSGILNDEDV
jgi:hypothetical protein